MAINQELLGGLKVLQGQLSTTRAQLATFQGSFAELKQDLLDIQEAVSGLGIEPPPVTASASSRAGAPAAGGAAASAGGDEASAALALMQVLQMSQQMIKEADRWVGLCRHPGPGSTAWRCGGGQEKASVVVGWCLARGELLALLEACVGTAPVAHPPPHIPLAPAPGTTSGVRS
jgi:hypothetical protein